MKKSFGALIVFVLLAQTGWVFAGIEWDAKIVSSRAGKEELVMTHVSAQEGNLREEYIEAGTDNILMKKGSYWLYKSAENVVYIVDPEEKTFMAVSIDSLGQLLGSLGKFMQVKISNPKVEVVKLAPEKIGTYDCNHININTSYDSEMKILIMKVKSHVEQSKEVWATNAISTQELAGSFMAKSYKTGMGELDEVLAKEMEAYKDLGFTVKSVTTDKSTAGNKTETSSTEMTVSNIATKKLDSGLFVVPADYKQVTFKTAPEEE
jgi:hypothetical protein